MIVSIKPWNIEKTKLNGIFRIQFKDLEILEYSITTYFVVMNKLGFGKRNVYSNLMMCRNFVG